MGKCLSWGSPFITDLDAGANAWTALGLRMAPGKGVRDSASSCHVAPFLITDQSMLGPILRRPQWALYGCFRMSKGSALQRFNLPDTVPAHCSYSLVMFPYSHLVDICRSCCTVLVSLGRISAPSQSSCLYYVSRILRVFHPSWTISTFEASRRGIYFSLNFLTLSF